MTDFGAFIELEPGIDSLSMKALEVAPARQDEDVADVDIEAVGAEEAAKEEE